jgi:tetratricopeptide (TPR) repeat protein
MPYRQAKRPLLIVAAALLVSSASGQNTPAQFDDLAAQAAQAREQQNLPLALELYRKAEELKPEWAEGWWYIGLLNYSSRQYAPAIDAFNHLLQVEPRAVPALALRGLCEFETGANDGSLRDLEQAVAHGAANDPNHEQLIRSHLGLLLAAQGRFLDAIGQYKFLAMKHVDPSGLPLLIGMAGMRVRSMPGDLNAQDRELYEAAGKAGYAFLADDTERADALFRELFVRYPTTPNIHCFYGLLLFPHDRESAVEQFQQEVVIAPSNELATALLAFTLMYVGRYSEALPVAERAFTASPNMEMAELALGRSLIETGDDKRGIELLNQVLQHNPKSLEAHVGLAAAYSREGRREDAYRERMVCLGLGK